jgi:demethoxyubiquinone hydroxylase (CLK1/Coq7/Cat5 family)
VSHDIGVIRPEMRVEQVGARGAELSPEERRAVRKALRTLHTLEIMATKIYACQISGNPPALRLALTAAMCNEITHMQDYQTKLYEYGMTPSKLRWAYWAVGYVLGFGSRLLGTRCRLRTGIWVELKAVDHYSHLLAAVDWDADTRATIEKDQADESGHIERWERFLEHRETMYEA